MGRHHQLKVARLKNSKKTTKIIKSLNSQSERLKKLTKTIPQTIDNGLRCSLNAITPSFLAFYLIKSLLQIEDYSSDEKIAKKRV